MEFTAAQIASFINGKIIGDENASISGVSPIENAEKGQLSFVLRRNLQIIFFHQTHLLLLFLKSL
jgi:UDP-3-O-[3-hydroxymyristoyl] glucosamine N-acyltransferase